MKLRHHDNGAALLERAGPFLRSRETLHSLIIALAERTPECVDPPYFATVEEGDRVLLVAMRTPPRSLLLSTLNGGATEDALDCIVDDLAKRGDSLPGATGPTDVSVAFGERWALAAGVDSRVRLRFKSFEADHVHMPVWPPGALRLAVEREADLLADWANRFVDETGLPEEDRLTPDDMLRRVRRGMMHVWTKDESPVTMAAGNKGALSRIGAVYTPPEHRHRGYASACVAALTTHLLEGGAKQVTLATDAANPTSNKIYTAIGYRHIGDDVMLSFERRA